VTRLVRVFGQVAEVQIPEPQIPVPGAALIIVAAYHVRWRSVPECEIVGGRHRHRHQSGLVGGVHNGLALLSSELITRTTTSIGSLARWLARRVWFNVPTAVHTSTSSHDEVVTAWLLGGVRTTHWPTLRGIRRDANDVNAAI